MQQANENQARRDRSCFESLTLWDLKSHNHNPSLWVVKDREEDVEYQERSESEEGDEEEEYVCVIIEGSEVEEDEEEEEEEEEYEVTCVGEYEEEEECLLEVVVKEEEEECLLEVVVKEEGVEEDEEERVERYEKEKKEKEEEEEKGEEEEEEEEETANTYPSVPMCSLLNHHFSHLATKFPECKFLMILAGQCVPNYPVSHLPHPVHLRLRMYHQFTDRREGLWREERIGRCRGAFVIDSYEALYQEGTPITTPRSEQDQEDYSDDQSDHYDNQGTEV
ncbi:cilia- and flagella-associated protein 251-like [Oncorhynchus mykiss]|uniref:cilia- and flagella-associated protein 251-like n=1 Tax=Oncorhynchus mykiss TaxID=8022 RepID=UPI001878B44C|nr:cilia- and flagella-associated protein 251-like [Oncorhynchus mykiss]